MPPYDPKDTAQKAAKAILEIRQKSAELQAFINKGIRDSATQTKLRDLLGAIEAGYRALYDVGTTTTWTDPTNWPPPPPT